jgi:protein pelota
MRLINKDVSEKDGKGSVKIRCDHPEDMWHTYNMINIGDRLRTTTLRKVVTESATGSTSSSKKRMNLTIEIETVDFDTEKCSLRVNGKNRAENPFVRMGQYHTLELELNKPFTVKHIIK